MIDVRKRELTMKVQDQEVIFNLLNFIKFSKDHNEDCYRVDLVDNCVEDFVEELLIDNSLESSLSEDKIGEVNRNYVHMVSKAPRVFRERPEILDTSSLGKLLRTSFVKATLIELTALPMHLKYAFLGGGSILPVIISAKLGEDQKGKLIRVLKSYKKVFDWTIAD